MFPSMYYGSNYNENVTAFYKYLLFLKSCNVCLLIRTIMNYINTKNTSNPQ